MHMLKDRDHIIKLSTCLFVLLTGLACAPQYSGKVPPKVINGEIDLTGWDFKKDGPVKLDGDWLFAWEKFVEPASWEQLQQQMVHTLPVPGYWHTLADPANPGQNLSGTGYASYAVHIKGVLSGDHLGLQMDDPVSASEIFTVNSIGQVISQVSAGEASPLAYLEVPKMNDYLLLKIGETSNISFSSYVLILRISNYHYYKGGPFRSPNLDKFQNLQARYHQDTGMQTFMMGILLIISLYHLSLFFFRPQDKTSLYFALTCSVLGLRLFSMGIAQRIGINDSVSAWLILSKIEYLSMTLGVTTFGYYLHTLILGKKHFKIWLFNLAFGVLLMFFVIVSSTLVYPKYLYINQLHMVVFLIIEVIYLGYLSIKKNRMAQVTLLSFLIVLLGIINDILNANQTIESGYIAPYGAIIMILLQSGLISSRSAKAYRTAEHLSEKLTQEVEKQSKKLNRIQYLSQDIQNTSNFDKMIKNLNQVLVSEFNISNYVFLLLNKEKYQLEVIKVMSSSSLPKRIIEEMYQRPLDLSHPKSLHGAIVKKGKPYFMSRLFDLENAPDEMKNRELLGMKSLFFLPLKVDGEVFAALSMTDTKFEAEDRVKYLKREERTEIEQLSQFVSSALYQAMQKEQIQKAKNEAERAQAAASRAKNKAAINQLAAHLAHEVNNPLNYIATGQTMQSDSFDKYHEMILGVLTGDDEDSLAFKEELEKLQDKFNRGIEQTNEGQGRIAKVIAEIRAITGVDGLNFTNFDIVPIINEEMVYSLHRNQVKIGEQAIKVTGTDSPIEVLSNQHILARSIRTVISNCIHFAREHKGNEGELYIDCRIDDNMLLMEMGNNSFSIKNEMINEIFDLEKSKSYGTEQIGMAMIKELLQKINCDLVLADHGRESGKVTFQLQVPLDI